MVTFLQSVEIFQHAALLILAKHNIHPGNIGHGTGLQLTVAACNNDIGIRVLANNLMDCLTAFLIGHLCN